MLLVIAFDVVLAQLWADGAKATVGAASVVAAAVEVHREERLLGLVLELLDKVDSVGVPFLKLIGGPRRNASLEASTIDEYLGRVNDNTPDGGGHHSLACERIAAHLVGQVEAPEVVGADSCFGSLLIHDVEICAVFYYAVEVAAIENVGGELEAEGQLNGGLAALQVVSLDAVLRLFRELIYVPDDGADKADAGFVAILEEDGYAALAVPRLGQGQEDDFFERLVDGHALSAEFVELLKAGGVDTAEDEVDGLLLRLDAEDVGVVVFAGANLGEVEGGGVPSDLDSVVETCAVSGQLGGGHFQAVGHAFTSKG